MTVLSVNVNKIALLRNARGGGRPSVEWAAQTCVDAGAGGITVHPRPDLRHIRPDDVFSLARSLHVEFNIEGNPFSGPSDVYPGFVEMVEAVRPAQATLVPDATDQLTSDHGWDLDADGERVRPLIKRIRRCGCRVSLFMDAVPDHMAAARDVGADRVELYTEDYARAHAAGDFSAVLERYASAAEAARSAGLGVNAGHDLNLENLRDFCRIPGILEVSIGQALISDALIYGLADTVRRYLACLDDA